MGDVPKTDFVIHNLVSLGYTRASGGESAVGCGWETLHGYGVFVSWECGEALSRGEIPQFGSPVPTSTNEDFLVGFVAAIGIVAVVVGHGEPREGCDGIVVSG